MRSRFFASAMCVCLLMPATNVYAQTLKEALASAYENNFSLHAKRSNLKVRDEDIAAAVSEFLPTVRFEYSNQHLDIKKSPSPLAVKNNTTGTRETETVQISQPIFDGGKSVANLLAARNSIQSAKHNLHYEEQSILSGAVKAYTDLVKAKESAVIAEHSYKVLERQLDVTRDRFKLGDVTKADVYQAESSFAGAQVSLTRAKANIEFAKAAFKNVIQQAPTDDIDFPVIEGEFPSFDAVLEQALSFHPAIKRDEYAQRAAKDNIFVSSGSLLPKVSLNLSKTWDDSPSYKDEDNSRIETIELRVSVPLYQSGVEYSNVRKQRRAFESAKDHLLNSKESIKQEAVRSWENYHADTANIISAEAAVKAAEIALEGVEQEFQLGSRTTLDVLDTEQKLFKAKLDLVEVKANRVISYYGLRAVMGELNPKALELDVPMYDADAYYNKAKFMIIGF